MISNSDPTRALYMITRIMPIPARPSIVPIRSYQAPRTYDLLTRVSDASMPFLNPIKVRGCRAERDYDG
jgi:hypothetical protein